VVANGINDSGQVVGTYLLNDPVDPAFKSERAFIWSSGSGMQDLGTFDDPSGSWANALGVNNSGQVVGWSSLQQNATTPIFHAILWSGGMQDLGTLPGWGNSKAHGINDSGQVVGNGFNSFNASFPDSFTDGHAFLWSGGMQDLGTLPGWSASIAYGINNNGQVVGDSFNSDSTSDTRAFLWSSESGMQDLSLLPGVVGTGWSVLSSARAINDAGQIVGWGINNGAQRAFLLSPAKCEVTVKRFGQCDITSAPGHWGDETYDHLNRSICSKGCALTSLTMALDFQGINSIPVQSLGGLVTIDPGFMNTFLIERKGYMPGGDVNWVRAIDAIRQSLNLQTMLVFDSTSFNSTSSSDLSRLLCEGNKGKPAPVIVGVDLRNANNGTFLAPSHFVLVTGQDVKPGVPTKFFIKDPGRATTSSLDDYGNQFVVRGVVKDPDADVSALVIAAEGNAELLVTDPSGKRTGFDPASRSDVREIGASNYFREGLRDEQDRAAPDAFNHSFESFQPAVGIYSVLVTGLGPGVYNLSIYVRSRDGSSAPSIEIQGVAGLGSSDSYRISFSPVPNEFTSVRKHVSFDVLRSELLLEQKLSQIGDDQFVRRLDKVLVKGREALNEGDKKQAVDELRKFLNHLERIAKIKETGNESDEQKEGEDEGRQQQEDEHDQTKRFVTVQALNLLRLDAQTLIADIGPVKRMGRREGGR